MGAWRNAATQYRRFGALDLHQLRFWNTVGDGTDSCRKGTDGTVPAGLLLHYDFTDCGKTIVDKSANGNDATIVSAMLKAASDPDKCGSNAPPPPTCKNPNSLVFDGDNDRMRLNGPLGSDANGKVTLEFWLSFTEVDTLQSLFNDGVGNGQLPTSKAFALLTPGSLLLYLREGSLRLYVQGAGPEVDLGWRPTAGAWTFLSLFYNAEAGSMSVFVDGFRTRTAQLETAGIPLLLAAPVIGAFEYAKSSYAYQANMQIYTTRAWSEERDGSESCPTGKEKNLMFYYDKLETNKCSDTVPDLSGKDVYATLTSTTYGGTTPVSKYNFCHLPDGQPKPTCPPNPSYIDFNGEYSRLKVGEISGLPEDPVTKKPAPLSAITVETTTPPYGHHGTPPCGTTPYGTHLSPFGPHPVCALCQEDCGNDAHPHIREGCPLARQVRIAACPSGDAGGLPERGQLNRQ